MPKLSSMTVFSIFGQIEEAAAIHMIGLGKGHRIEPEHIPEAEKYNLHGEPAKFAIVLTSKKDVEELEELIHNLYA